MHVNVCAGAGLSSGSKPNDVPAAFNNSLFIEGIILQHGEPGEAFGGILMY